jgi:tRNA 2-(methylsulfanyl)-N6-isopentenyladenosine37 hydroxylase
VLQVLEARGLSLGKDPGDPYAQKLQRLIRTSPLERRLDRLLVACVIEARSAERLSLLSNGLSHPELKALYRELAQSELGHETLFFRLAAVAHGQSRAQSRLDALLDREAEILIEVGLRPAIH